MEGGIISLKDVYFFARQHTSRPAEAMIIDGKSDLGNKYSSLCREIRDRLPIMRGLYLWGFYNRNGFWTNIYIGKAGLKKTASLQNRIYKELTAERACIWREVLSTEQLERICKEIHPRMWRRNLPRWRNACEKAGSTHIAWVSLPDVEEENIESIENDLIEAMNPTGNRKRTQPPEHFRADTKRVFGRFREVINANVNRQTRFSLNLHREFWKQLA